MSKIEITTFELRNGNTPISIGSYFTSRDAFYEDFLKNSSIQLVDLADKIRELQTTIDKLAKEEEDLHKQVWDLVDEEKELLAVVKHIRKQLGYKTSPEEKA